VSREQYSPTCGGEVPDVLVDQFRALDEVDESCDDELLPGLVAAKWASSISRHTYYVLRLTELN
jgi:hypothetical protein